MHSTTAQAGQAARHFALQCFGGFGHGFGVVHVGHSAFGHPTAFAKHAFHGLFQHAAFAHLLHHIGHLAVLFHKLVQLGHFEPSALGDPLLAAGREQIRVGPLFLGHRVDECDLPFQDAVIHPSRRHLFPHLGRARHHAHHAFHAAHFHHLLKLHLEVVHVEAALLKALHHAFGLFGFDGLLGFFDKGNNVAHAKDTACNPVRLEGFDRVHLFAKTNKANGFTGDCAHGKRSTAASVAVHPGEHHTSHANFVVEFLCDVHCVLAGQAVNDQKCFAWLGHIANRSSLRDQLLIDVQTACGVEHIDVIAAKACLGFRAFRDRYRVFALYNRQCVDTDLPTQDRQLFHRRGAVCVERCHQHPLAFAFFQPFGQFGRCCRFTGALQSDHQDWRWWAVNFQRARVFVAGKNMFQLVMDDLNDLLARRDRLRDGLACCLVLNRFDEITCDWQRDVGLKQCHAHFAQRCFDVIIRQRTLLGKLVKDAGKAIG